jgi:hypothetical protein
MNRLSFLNLLVLAPISSLALDVEDILGTAPKQAIPEWPFRAIPLNGIQKIIWEDYHKLPYNIFIRTKGRESIMAEKISELYLGELKQITISGVKFSSKDNEILIEELDFNNYHIDDPIWQGLFLEDFPDKLKKVTIFTEMDFPNHKFLQGLSESGKFNIKVFDLKEAPIIQEEMIFA